MRAPHAADLLNAWDSGAQASSAQRALLLLRTVRPESLEELSAMPLGWVAAQLLTLRGSLLGPTLVCLVSCRQCDTVIESQVEIEQLTALAGEAPSAGSAVAPLRFVQDDYLVEFRLPTSADLLALRGGAQDAGRTLAHGLVVRSSHDGAAVVAADLPIAVKAGLERAVLEHDPLAQIELGLACPTCQFTWSEPLQVTEFIWTELSAFAQRLLQDVARLASAFGWREADILDMSAVRRRCYLDLLAA
jgi:hypothetical protein